MLDVIHTASIDHSGTFSSWSDVNLGRSSAFVKSVDSWLSVRIIIVFILDVESGDLVFRLCTLSIVVSWISHDYRRGIIIFKLCPILTLVEFLILSQDRALSCKYFLWSTQISHKIKTVIASRLCLSDILDALILFDLLITRSDQNRVISMDRTSMLYRVTNGCS